MKIRAFHGTLLDKAKAALNDGLLTINDYVQMLNDQGDGERFSYSQGGNPNLVYLGHPAVAVAYARRRGKDNGAECAVLEVEVEFKNLRPDERFLFHHHEQLFGDEFVQMLLNDREAVEAGSWKAWTDERNPKSLLHLYKSVVHLDSMTEFADSSWMYGKVGHLGSIHPSEITKLHTGEELDILDKVEFPIWIFEKNESVHSSPALNYSKRPYGLKRFPREPLAKFWDGIVREKFDPFH